MEYIGQEPKKPWYKFKDDPLARIFFGVFMLFITVKNLGISSFTSAEAAGNSSFHLLMIVLFVWLIVSGVRKQKAIYSRRHQDNAS